MVFSFVICKLIDIIAPGSWEMEIDRPVEGNGVLNLLTTSLTFLPLDGIRIFMSRAGISITRSFTVARQNPPPSAGWVFSV